MNNLNMIKPDYVQNIINKFCYTIGMLPTSYKISLTYEEQILCIGKYLEETVYPAINNNAEALAELQTLFAELKNYVDNYFEDLDVQEEINNKLNAMAESGELQEIMADYLNTKAIFAFNTVDEMKASENIIAGSYAKTYGYYSNGDKGEAFYYITDTLPENKYYETLNSGKYAILLIENIVNVRQFGAKGNSANDDTLAIQNAIEYAGENGTVILPSGTYKIKDQLRLPNGMTFKGESNATILVADDYIKTYPEYDESIISNKNRSLTSYDAKNIRIENIKVINHIQNTSHMGIIHFNGTDNVVIKNCTIEFDNATETAHSWGIILLGANKNTLVDHVNIINSSPEGTLGGCIWVRGAYPEGNTPTLNVNVTNSYFESSGVDEITCIDEGANGCQTECNMLNCTVIGTAQTTLPNFLSTIIASGADSKVTGNYSNMIIKGNCNEFAVALGEINYDNIENIIASISDSTIEVNSGKGIIGRNIHFKVNRCHIKVPTGNIAVQKVSVSNSNIIGKVSGSIVDNCHIISSTGNACDDCPTVINSSIETTGTGVHYFGTTKNAIVSNNKIKADTYGIFAQNYNGSVDRCLFTNNIIERLNNSDNGTSIGIYLPTMTGKTLVANNIITGVANNTQGAYYGYRFPTNLNASIDTSNNITYYLPA